MKTISSGATQPLTNTCADGEVDPMVLVVSTLFRAFARAFGPLWAAQFSDPAAPKLWERQLSAEHITPQQVRLSIALGTKRPMPPTLGQFIELCRPPLPDELVCMAQAGRWARGETVEWLHPIAAATAKAVGAWTLRTGDVRDLRRVWGNAWRQSVDRWNRGESLDQPVMLALPKEVRRTIEPGAPTPPTVAAEWEKVARLFGGSL